MGTFLYNVIVKPLELIIELVFAVPYWYTQNPILSIVAVSVFVNILTLPLYRRSDALQSREREEAVGHAHPQDVPRRRAVYDPFYLLPAAGI